MKNNKLVIGLVLVAIALAGVYVAAAITAEYTLTVSSSQNTVLSVTNGTFGSMMAGTTNTISPTFTLNNTGNVVANVTAAFTTNYTTTFGMVNGTYAIPGTAFELSNVTNGMYTALGATANGVVMTDTVGINATNPWMIKVNVPSGQEAGAYTGTIEVTFE